MNLARIWLRDALKGVLLTFTINEGDWLSDSKVKNNSLPVPGLGDRPSDYLRSGACRLGLTLLRDPGVELQ